MFKTIKSSIKLAVCASTIFFVSASFADIEKARKLLDAGNSSAALIELETDIAIKPTAEAEFLRAVILQGSGQRGQAMEAYASMILSYPELPEPYNNLAVMHAEDKNFEKAVQMLEKAILTNKSYATAYENLGDIYTQRASSAYNEALALAPSNSKTVEVKLNLIDRILLPPAMRKPLVNAGAQPIQRPAQAQASTQTAQPINRPAPRQAQTNVTPSNVAPRNTSSSSASFDSAAVSQVVSAWASAWSSKDVNSYLSHYSDDFRPVGGASKSSWANYRAERLQAPRFINVGVSNLRITKTSNGARATFTQDYQADTYEDRVSKRLDLVSTPQGWKIRREQSSPL